MPKIVASGVQVFCRHDALEATAKQQPNPQNPNTHPPEQIARLVDVIRANGWRMPITVSTRSGMITKGHGRLLAAQEAKLNTVPVEYQEYKDEATEWADVLADNAIPELGETDESLVVAALKKLRREKVELTTVGYSDAEFKQLIERMKGSPETAKNRTTNPPPPPQAEGRKSITLHYTQDEHREFEQLSGEAMKALELLTVSDTMLRLVTEAAK